MMTEILSNSEPLFSKVTLEKIPLFYSFLVRYKTKDLGELKVQVKFSSSYRHFSKKYINHPGHKPISDIGYLEIISALSESKLNK